MLRSFDPFRKTNLENKNSRTLDLKREADKIVNESSPSRATKGRIKQLIDSYNSLLEQG